MVAKFAKLHVEVNFCPSLVPVKKSTQQSWWYTLTHSPITSHLSILLNSIFISIFVRFFYIYMFIYIPYYLFMFAPPPHFHSFTIFLNFYPLTSILFCFLFFVIHYLIKLPALVISYVRAKEGNFM